MRTLFGFLFSIAAIFANPMGGKPMMESIGTQNQILASVEDRTISILDVKKKMDIVFYQKFPEYSDSDRARYQFYTVSWKNILKEMIDQELILKDALDKGVKISDGEIREALEDRFGPSVALTLDKIGVTYEEAWKMVKDEIIVQMMSGWFVHTKAGFSVTPQEMKKAYQSYLEENPPSIQWAYRVISLKGDEAGKIAPKLHRELIEAKRTPSKELLEKIAKKYETDRVKIAISSEFQGKSEDLSETHRVALEPLKVQGFSAPLLQSSRSSAKKIFRIFHLIEKKDLPAPTFADLSTKLKQDLTQKAVAKESERYVAKLRKRYGYESTHRSLEDLHPFSIQ